MGHQRKNNKSTIFFHFIIINMPNIFIYIYLKIPKLNHKREEIAKNEISLQKWNEIFDLTIYKSVHLVLINFLNSWFLCTKSVGLKIPTQPARCEHTRRLRIEILWIRFCTMKTSLDIRYINLHFFVLFCSNVGICEWEVCQCVCVFCFHP